MSTFQTRSGVSGIVNLDLADLLDGSKAIEHVVLGADGNPMVPVQDASIQALVGAVQSSVAAAQTYVTSRLLTIVDAFGGPVVTSITPNPANATNTDVFGNPLS